MNKKIQDIIFNIISGSKISVKITAKFLSSSSTGDIDIDDDEDDDYTYKIIIAKYINRKPIIKASLHGKQTTVFVTLSRVGQYCDSFLQITDNMDVGDTQDMVKE